MLNIQFVKIMIFSNNLVIKIQIESRDSKSVYPYYILAKSDFSVEAISSSAMSLGLTMDLLKKYVIKLNILIRTIKDNYLNLFDKYKNYEEESKKVIWVYPDMIYPKNDITKKKDIQIQDLIRASNKKAVNMQIIEMKFRENEILCFAFKFTEINKKKSKDKKINFQNYIPTYKNEIIFDLLNLKYIRAVIVKKKSGLKNIIKIDEENDTKDNLREKSIQKKRIKTRNDFIENSSNDENIDVVITKDKLLELQGKDSNEIKNFINSLPFYGNEISLIKHRPNREKYPSGKAQEPLIKIDLSKTIKRIDLKLKENPELYKKFKNIQTENKNSSTKNINIEVKNNFNSGSVKQNEINNKENDEANRDFMGNNSIYLMNLFNVKSLKIIKYVDY